MLPRYPGCDEMFLQPHLTRVVGVSNRFGLPPFQSGGLSLSSHAFAFCLPSACVFHLPQQGSVRERQWKVKNLLPHHHRRSRHRSGLPVTSMDPWGRSGFSEKIALWLIEDGLLHLVMSVTLPECIIPCNEDELCTLPRTGVQNAHEQLLPWSSPLLRD
jgi:hypothetical protein